MPDDHERTDASVRGIAFAGVGLAAFVAAALGASTLMYRGFGALERNRDNVRQREEPASSSLASGGLAYGGPLLQVRPEDELAQRRRADAATLGVYAWENKAAGAVRVPIERAMSLLVQRGLPPPPGPPASFEDLQRQRGKP